MLGDKKRQLVTDYNVAFNSESGKRVLADLRRKCPTLDSSVNMSKGIDVNCLLVHEGRRSVVLHIFKMLNIDPYAEKANKVTQEQV